MRKVTKLAANAAIKRENNFEDEKSQTSTTIFSVSFYNYNCLSFESHSHGDLQAENLEYVMHKIYKEKGNRQIIEELRFFHTIVVGSDAAQTPSRFRVRSSIPDATT